MYRTDSTDRQEAESAVLTVYSHVGRRKPKIIFFDSPFQMAAVPWLSKYLAGLDLSRGSEIGEAFLRVLNRRVLNRIRNPWGRPLRDWWIYLENQLDNRGLGRLLSYPPELCKPVWLQLHDMVRREKDRQSPLFSEIWGALSQHPFWNEVAAAQTSASAEFWSRAKENLEIDGFMLERGCMWLWNRAYYLATDDIIQKLQWYRPDPKLEAQWNDWTRLVKAVHGILMYDDYCLIAERPTRLLVDSNGRLHNTSAPALQYADGFAIYSWHGDRVNWHQSFVLEQPALITLSHIEAETDASTRAIMIQQYGEHRYLSEINAVEIHRDGYGVLYRTYSKSMGPSLMVKAFDPVEWRDDSCKEYFFPVLKADIQTARDAVAASDFWLNPKHYEPVGET
ncbi:MAG TPA: hypothetical protein V6D08_17630 [Candidatus Obscuribacterales bacterium]